MPITDSPTRGSGKGTENLQGIWLWRPVGFDYRTCTPLGTQTLGRHKQNLVCASGQEKGVMTPQETVRFACECSRVSAGGMGRQWPAARSGALTTKALGVLYKFFWRKLPSPPLPPPWCGFRPRHREGTQPHPSVENWIKDLLSMASPTRARPSLHHRLSNPHRQVWLSLLGRHCPFS